MVAARVDAFHVSGGVIDRLVTGMVNTADDGDEVNVAAAAAVKQVVGVPVIAVGRIHDPQRAEWIVANGRADFIAMGRPMLADPELPNKLASGQSDRIRRCISCENCIDAMEQRFSVDCAVNPRTGKERELAVHPAARSKHVVVVGSGPAGMEAARVAADRGHRVTLFERNGQLGGALLWASILHPETEPFLSYLRDEIGRGAAKVVLGHEVSAGDIVDLHPTWWWWPPAGGSCCRASPVPIFRMCSAVRHCASFSPSSWAVGVSGWCDPPRSGWQRGPGCRSADGWSFRR